MEKHRIEIAVDTIEADEFAAWLNSQGHNATVGTSTGNYVDGEWTSASEEAIEIMRVLWEEYCNR